MATKYQNLSEYNAELMPDKETVSNQHYSIAVADWNPKITHTMLQGAIDTLVLVGVKEDNINVVHVPGTFELTFAAKQLMSSEKYNAIIVLGCVIQGDTPHFDYVCQSVTSGITELNLRANSCPVIFGVLTTNTLQQALDRSSGIHGNKGVEAATTAIKMANILW
ncbi:MAG: 6,7-dimethyl-8-ribityllumazine synthase [Paludibacter sp.]|nr:6,7-dimethyl-8-ribityllumazine synthase [Paludibacter sp.]